MADFSVFDKPVETTVDFSAFDQPVEEPSTELAIPTPQIEAQPAIQETTAVPAPVVGVSPVRQESIDAPPSIASKIPAPLLSGFEGAVDLVSNKLRTIGMANRSDEFERARKVAAGEQPVKQVPVSAPIFGVPTTPVKLKEVDIGNQFSVNLADKLDNILPADAKKKIEDVAGGDISFERFKSDPTGMANTILTAAFGSVPLMAQSVAANALGQTVGGKGVGFLGGAAIMSTDEAGAWLRDSKGMSGEMTPEQFRNWREITDKYAPIYGLISGSIEHAGNTVGAARQWKKALMGKGTQEVAKQKGYQEVLKFLGGIVGEGLEEVGQAGLQNNLMARAIEEMQQKHPEWKAPFENQDLWKSFKTGMSVSAVMSLLGLGAGKIRTKLTEKEEPEGPKRVSKVKVRKEVAEEKIEKEETATKTAIEKKAFRKASEKIKKTEKEIESETFKNEFNRLKEENKKAEKPKSQFELLQEAKKNTEEKLKVQKGLVDKKATKAAQEEFAKTHKEETERVEKAKKKADIKPEERDPVDPITSGKVNTEPGKPEVIGGTMKKGPKTKQDLADNQKKARDINLKERGMAEGGTEGLTLPTETLREKIIRRFQDDLGRLKKAQKVVGRITDEVDTYQEADLRFSRTKKRIDNFKDKYQKPLLDIINKSGLDVLDVIDYAYAKHAPQRNLVMAERNIGQAGQKDITALSGMSDQEAQDIINRVEKSGKKEDYERVNKEIRKIIDFTLDTQVKEGLLSPDNAREMKETFGPDYIPLRGKVFEDGTQANYRAVTGKSKLGLKGRESKAALGRQSRALDVLGNIVAIAQEKIVRAEKNKVAQTFLRFVRANPAPNIWEVKQIDFKPKLDEETGELRFSPEAPDLNKFFPVKEGGKQYHIRIKDPLLLQALNGLDSHSAETAVDIALRAGSMINRYKAAIVTRFSPEFILRNALRDVQTAAISASVEHGNKVAAKTVRDVPVAIKNIYQSLRGKKDNEWQRTWDDFQREGGRIDFFGLKEADKIQKDIMRELSLLKPTNKSRIIKVYRKSKDLVDNLNTAVENGARLALYKNLIDVGVSKKKAAAAAKNVTVNFNRKGEFGSFFNGLYLFANAAIQGQKRVVDIMTTKKGLALAGTASVASFWWAQLMRQIAGEDEDGVNHYDKISDWDKERNLIFARPDGKTPLKVPLPYGFNIPWVVGQSADKIWHGGDKAREVVNLVQATANAFNPLGSDASLLHFIMPTVGDLFVDLGMNMDYSGNPIRKEQMPGQVKKPKSELHFKSVSPASKKITQTLNEISGGTKHVPGDLDFNPENIDHIAEFFVGGTGRFLKDLGGTVKDVAAGDIKTREPRKIPFVRVFVVGSTEYKTQKDFFKNVDTFRQFEKDVKSSIKDKKPVDINKRAAINTLKQMLEPKGKEKGIVDRLKVFRKKRNEFLDEGNKEAAKNVDKLIASEYKKFNKKYNKLKKFIK